VRPQLIREPNEQAFLLGYQGKRIRYEALLKMLKNLQQRTGDDQLQQKTIGLHALRHSIATHLMQRGMKFDYISQFLGHTNLSSTQIYTHLAYEYETHDTA
jgi:integrase/recombinase XerD